MSGNNDYATEKVDTYRNFSVTSDTTLVDLHSKVVAEYATMNMPCDHVAGKLFYAASAKGCKMLHIFDKTIMKNAFAACANNNTKILQVAIGARPADFEEGPAVPIATSQGGSLLGLRDPPELPAFAPNSSKSGKKAAKADQQQALKIKNYFDRLYTDAGSPLWHGFTTYHACILRTEVKEWMSKQQDDSLPSDLENDEYPSPQLMAELAPAHGWEAEFHVKRTMGVVMERGTCPPNRAGNMPSPAEVIQSRETRGGGKNGSGATEDAYLPVLAELVQSIKATASSSSSAPAPAAAQTALGMPVPASPAPAPLPVHGSAAATPAAVPVGGDAARMATLKRKLQNNIDEIIQKKVNYQQVAASEAVTAALADLDARMKSYGEALKKLQDKEDEELFLELNNFV